MTTSFLDANNLTLADVLARVEDDLTLPESRRRALCSAVRELAVLLGGDLSKLPARVPKLTGNAPMPQSVQAKVPAKTLRKIREDAQAALRSAGIFPSLRAVSAPPAWMRLNGLLPNTDMKNGLSHFIRYCNATGTAPECVDDGVVDRFVSAIRADNQVGRPNAVHRRTCYVWNKAVDLIAEWPAARLSVPSYRKPPTNLRVAAFPLSFQHEVNEHLAWLGSKDVFAQHPAPRVYRPESIRMRRDHIQFAASAFARRGHPPHELTSLADLVEPWRVKEILRHYINQDTGEVRVIARHIAQSIVSIARDWLRVDETLLDELRHIRFKLGPQEATLKQKNRAALRQFDDEGNRRALLELPWRLKEEAYLRDTGSLRSAVTMQLAVAIQILIEAPIRSKNLTALSLDNNLVRPEGERGPLHLVVHEDESKNSARLEFELSDELSDLIEEYTRRFRRRLALEDNCYLFPAQHLGRKYLAHKLPQTLTYQIRLIVRKWIGLDLTPHQFRHLSAKFILQDDPGNIAAVGRLLGNRNHQTTSTYYAGLLCSSAVEYFGHIFEKERKRLSQSNEEWPQQEQPDQDVKAPGQMKGRKIVGFARWPEIDRQAWSRALRSGDRFDGRGLAAHWSKASLRAAKDGYGRWIGYLAAEEPEALKQSPGDRMTPERLKRFVEAIGPAVTANSLLNYVNNSHSALRVMAPEEDWSWLRKVIRRLFWLLPPKKPQQRVPSPVQLWDLGIALMESAHQKRRPSGSAIAYRDGLMIALLARIPLQRRYLVSMRLGRNLVVRGASYWVIFSEQETTYRIPMEFAVPDELVPYVAKYLQELRPRLFMAGFHDGLWPSAMGGPMTAEQMCTRIYNHTREAFGIPITPRFFRVAAAKAIARHEPENLQMTKDLLGLKGFRAVERFHAQAQTIEASRRYRAVISNLRGQPKDLRDAIPVVTASMPAIPPPAPQPRYRRNALPLCG